MDLYKKSLNRYNEHYEYKFKKNSVKKDEMLKFYKLANDCLRNYYLLDDINAFGPLKTKYTDMYDVHSKHETEIWKLNIAICVLTVAYSILWLFSLGNKNLFKNKGIEHPTSYLHNCLVPQSATLADNLMQCVNAIEVR